MKHVLTLLTLMTLYQAGMADGTTTTKSTVDNETTATTTDSDGNVISTVTANDEGIRVYSAQTGNLLMITGDGQGSAQSGTTGLTISKEGVTKQDGTSVKLGDNINKLKSQSTVADFMVNGNRAISTNTGITATNNESDRSSLSIKGDTTTVNVYYDGMEYGYSGSDLNDYLLNSDDKYIVGTNSETGNTMTLFSEGDGQKWVTINDNTTYSRDRSSNSGYLTNPNTGMQISKDSDEYTIKSPLGISITANTQNKTATFTRDGQSKTFEK